MDMRRLDLAMKAMKALDEDMVMSADEDAMIAADPEVQGDLGLLVSAQRSLLQTHIPVPDLDGELARITGQRHDEEAPEYKHRPGIVRYLLAGLIGAAAMLAVIVAFGYIRNLSPEQRMLAEIKQSAETSDILTVETAAGETMTLNMADGTSITLNDNSRLDYPRHFDGNTRTVHLQGEALFKVSKDKHHPFIVLTEHLTTRVLGTTFDIKAYPNQPATVALVEGSVEVTDIASNRRQTIKPGEKIKVDPAGTVLINKVNTDEETAWSDGLFYFDNQRLEDIMQELGRWYNIPVVFRDASLKDLELNFATQRRASLTETLELLNSMQRFSARLQDQQIVIE